jgi:hypothetical protein
MREIKNEKGETVARINERGEIQSDNPIEAIRVLLNQVDSMGQDLGFLVRGVDLVAKKYL